MYSHYDADDGHGGYAQCPYEAVSHPPLVCSEGELSSEAVNLGDALVSEQAGSVVFPLSLELTTVSQAICVIFLISFSEGLP